MGRPPCEETSLARLIWLGFPFPGSTRVTNESYQTDPAQMRVLYPVTRHASGRTHSRTDVRVAQAGRYSNYLDKLEKLSDGRAWRTLIERFPSLLARDRCEMQLLPHERWRGLIRGRKRTSDLA
jgi:hypothetical protein